MFNGENAAAKVVSLSFVDDRSMKFALNRRSDSAAWELFAINNKPVPFRLVLLKYILLMTGDQWCSRTGRDKGGCPCKI